MTELMIFLISYPSLAFDSEAEDKMMPVHMNLHVRFVDRCFWIDAPEPVSAVLPICDNRLCLNTQE